MYKETIVRKRIPVIFMLLILLVLTLFSFQIIEDLTISGYNLGDILTIFITCIVFIIFVIQVLKCKVKYTYSVIADEFIIHKLNGNQDKVVENIKIKDIEFIGVNNKETTSKYPLNSKKYICSIFCKNPYCCVYKNGKKFKKFYFESSYSLVRKIKIIKKKSY